MFSLFSRTQETPKTNPSMTALTGKVASAAEAGKVGIEGATAVLAFVGIASSGPALPVVLAVSTTVLVMAKMYSQTKTLGKEFTKTYKVIIRVQKVLAKLAAINETNPGRIQIDLTDLIDAINDIQSTIAKLAPPKVLAKINEALRQGGSKEQIEGPNGPVALAKGFIGRWVLSSSKLQDLQQKRTNLALQLSVVSAELSLELDKPANAELAAIPEKPISPQDAANAETQMEKIAAQEPAQPVVGGTRRQRRHRSKTTRKNKLAIGAN